MRLGDPDPLKPQQEQVGARERKAGAECDVEGPRPVRAHARVHKIALLPDREIEGVRCAGQCRSQHDEVAPKHVRQSDGAVCELHLKRTRCSVQLKLLRASQTSLHALDCGRITMGSILDPSMAQAHCVHLGGVVDVDARTLGWTHLR